MTLTADMLTNLARETSRAATARIGSAQRRAHAEEAKQYAAKLGMTEHGAVAASAALLACMAAQAWNENKAANQRRLRHANRFGSAERFAMLFDSATSVDDLDAEVEQRQYLDAECARTYDAANALRTQARSAAGQLRHLAARIAVYGS